MFSAFDQHGRYAATGGDDRQGAFQLMDQVLEKDRLYVAKPDQVFIHLLQFPLPLMGSLVSFLRLLIIHGESNRLEKSNTHDAHTGYISALQAAIREALRASR